MKKKIGAFLLVVVLAISNLVPAYGNIQLPVANFVVDNVYYVVGENVVTGDPILNPVVSVSWTDPDSWADDTVVHDPDYYEITVENKTTNTIEKIKINSGTADFTAKKLDLHNRLNLKTGSFYDISIQPYHYHVVSTGTELVNTLAPSAQEPFHRYVVTDPDVEFVADEERIQVIWDDMGMPEYTYRIVYAIGDYSNSSKQTFLNNKEGEVTGLSINSDDVESFYDPIAKRNKLTYTLTKGVYPGQIYSIMVEPVAEFYNGNTINRNRNYPYIKSVSTTVKLTSIEEGDYLRLQWDIPSAFKVGQSQEEYSLVEATLLEFQGGQGRNIAIFNGDAAAIGYYRLKKPVYETEYEIRLIYRAVNDASKPDITPISNRLLFQPSEYIIRPTKPYVPSVLNKTILEELKATYPTDQVYQKLSETYLVPGYSYTGTLDKIFEPMVTFHVDSTLKALNFVWGAFQRIDVDQTSSNYGKYIYDNNVYYDIWVTDELSTLAYATPVIENVRFNNPTDSHVILNSSGQIVGYKQLLNFYYNTEEKDVLEITPNDIYYVKVQAKKMTSQGVLTSEPTIKSVYYTYGGASYEPPVIAKPPLKVKESETTTTGVTINWKEKWFEAIATDLPSGDLLSSWQHELWVGGDGTMYDEAVDGTTYFPLYEGEEQIQALRDYLASLGLTPTIVSRQVDLGTDDFGVSDVKYKFIKVLYQTVLNTIATRKAVDPAYDFKAYYKELVEKDKNGTGSLPWEDIVTYTEPSDESYHAYRDDSLVPNTSYLFILYPYREIFSGELLYAHYPTPIVVSTLPVIDEVKPDPTVPSLYVTDATDGSITVSWKYNKDFVYDLMVASTESLEEATAFPIVLPTNQLDALYPKDGQYYNVTVDDLFPESTYYFYIRARQVSGTKVSLWSNPAVGATLSATPPLPPRGLGLAPVTRISAYGYEQNITDEHFVIEWIKDLQDIEQPDGDKVKRSYGYIVEIADNPKFIDPLYVESLGGSEDIVPTTIDILEKNLIAVNDLVGNRHYYVRAKTKLIIEGSEEGQYIELVSNGYTQPLRLITLAIGDEYDGLIDPALTILPNDDYELIYQEAGQYLEYRFRTDLVDQDGSSDNSVDQRLISSLISDKVHEYIIDLRAYADQKVTYRRITLPYTIVSAFDTYQINMKILTDEMTLTLPMSGVSDTIKDQVKAYGVAPSLIIDIENLSNQSVKAELKDSSLKDIGTPQKLFMSAISSRKSDPIYYADQAMTIGLKTNSRYGVYEKDTAVYVKDRYAKWRTIGTKSYDAYESLMVFETPYIGTYGLFVVDRQTAVAGSNSNPTHWSEAYRKEVYTKYAISGIKDYNPEGLANEKMLLNAAYGSAMKQTTIELAKTLDATTLTTINRSGLKQGTSQSLTKIERQEAISTFVRVYELVHQTKVAVDTKLVASLKNSGVSSQYLESMAKAKSLGLISDLTTIRPKDAIKNGEFFTLWAKAIK